MAVGTLCGKEEGIGETGETIPHQKLWFRVLSSARVAGDSVLPALGWAWLTMGVANGTTTVCHVNIM